MRVVYAHISCIWPGVCACNKAAALMPLWRIYRVLLKKKETAARKNGVKVDA